MLNPLTLVLFCNRKLDKMDKKKKKHKKYQEVEQSDNEEKKRSGVLLTIILFTNYYTLSQKSDTDVTHYRFNPHQPISVIFGRDVAERVCYWMVIYYPTSPN